jgi:drug/metabolite transporter (DMT)-like permease
MIIWAAVFGYLFFGDIPTLATLVGVTIIIGAGLFIFFREQRGRRAAAVAPPRG